MKSTGRVYPTWARLWGTRVKQNKCLREWDRTWKAQMPFIVYSNTLVYPLRVELKKEERKRLTGQWWLYCKTHVLQIQQRCALSSRIWPHFRHLVVLALVILIPPGSSPIVILVSELWVPVLMLLCKSVTILVGYRHNSNEAPSSTQSRDKLEC